MRVSIPFLLYRSRWRRSLVYSAAVSRQFYLLLYTIGNFGFGIDEHIDLGIKYDTSTGIFGMDFYVCLTRAGKRVSKRRARTNRFGKFQRVTKDESKLWFIEKFGGSILN